MKTILSLSVCLAVALPLFPLEDCSPELAALHAFYDLRAMIVDEDASSYALTSRVAEHLEKLRDPLPEGGYRWVKFVRPRSGSGPVVKKEHLIQAVQGAEAFDAFDASADHVYAVRVAVPRKRSLMSANKEAYLGTLEVRYWVDGEEKKMTRTVNQWIKPDTSRSFDLGAIADRAEATLEVATRAGTVRQSLAEIHFTQAVAQDDPDSPNYEAVVLLKNVQYDPSPKAIDEEIARLERQAFGTSSTVPFAQIAVALRDSERLMASSDEKEQEKGRKILADTLRLLH